MPRSASALARSRRGILPYERYESAEAFKRMSQTTGEASGLFRKSAPAKAAGAELRSAQAEANIRCF